MLNHLLTVCRQRLASDYRLQVLLVIVSALALAGIWKFKNRNIESTDNATLQCEMADVVSEVRGTIEKIYFEDNQFVAKDVALVKIEDAVYRAQFERAEAALNVAQSAYRNAENNVQLVALELQADIKKTGVSSTAAGATVRAMQASIAETKEDLRAANIDVDYYRQSYERDRELNDYKAIAGKEFENSQRAYAAKVANRDAMVAKIAKLEKLYEAEQAQAFNSRTTHDTLVRAEGNKLASVRTEAVVARDKVAVARAEFNLARLNLERTTSRAKLPGTVTNRRLSAGEYIEVGQRIATIVACHDKPWVTANFKETQLARMKKGQRAEITVDTYPGVVFKGTLDSISSGSGSTFSVLPPENATGNFTKVVKRMPVKIRLDGPVKQELRVGSSVLVDVHVQ